MEINDVPSPLRIGTLQKLLVRIAGADIEILAQCPRRDLETICAVAEIMIFTAIYQFSLLTVVGTRLFPSAGTINPAIPIAAGFIALFILKVDAYTIMRSGWHLSGISELKRGGLDISGGMLARVKSACQLSVRILLAFGLAQLTAIFVCILVFAHDIDARIESDNRHANQPLVMAATERIEAELKRQRDAIASETAAIDRANGEALVLRQRENDLASSEPRLQDAQAEIAELLVAKTKADSDLQEAETFAINEAAGIKGATNNSGQIGEGVRFRAASERVANAKAHAAEAAATLDAAHARADALGKDFTARTNAARRQIDDQLASIEKSVTSGKARLTELNEGLSRTLQGRDATISSAVTKSEDYAPRRDGLLIQIAALHSIADANPEIAVVILLIEVTSFGLELAAVLTKITSFVPTSYAAYLARDAYMRAVNLVEGMVRDLEEPSTEPQDLKSPPNIPPANDNHLSVGDTETGEEDNLLGDETPPPQPPQPPKRPRGRPRKTPAV